MFIFTLQISAEAYNHISKLTEALTSSQRRQIAHHLLKTTDEKVGYIALEENVERSSQGILGIEIKKLLHLEPFEVDEEYRKGFDATIGSGRFFVYDHWGSLDTEELLSHVRYMIKAEGVTHIVLDHI